MIKGKVFHYERNSRGTESKTGTNDRIREESSYSGLEPSSLPGKVIVLNRLPPTTASDTEHGDRQTPKVPKRNTSMSSDMPSDMNNESTDSDYSSGSKDGDTRNNLSGHYHTSYKPFPEQIKESYAYSNVKKLPKKGPLTSVQAMIIELRNASSKNDPVCRKEATRTLPLYSHTSYPETNDIESGTCM